MQNSAAGADDAAAKSTGICQEALMMRTHDVQFPQDSLWHSRCSGLPAFGE